MSKRTQLAAVANMPPLWKRVFAAFCVLLAFGAATAQASHIHGQLLPHQSAHVGSVVEAVAQGGEEHCQLCQAMHSVLPAASSDVVRTTLLLQVKLGFQLDRLPETLWQFAMFSRPPPALLS